MTAARQIDHTAADAAHAALLGALALKALQKSVEAQAIAANGVPGYRPQHGRDGGEMATTLDTLPVLVKYELTWDGCDEIAEVTEVSIAGHTMDASNFAADVRAEWARECMAARGGL